MSEAGTDIGGPEAAAPDPAPPAPASPKPASLWAYALDVYGRPGAAARFLDLQDAYGQNVPYLIWSLWMAAERRAADAATLAAGAALARSWEAAAVAPLRRLRRDLKRASAGTARRREGLRGAVQQLELKAERMLLDMLEDASPAADPGAGGGPLPAADALAAAAAAWGEPAPADLLRALAGAVA
ncbi:MAG TPA: TIGR02444 family protein [Caulobacteraceae bacterium]